MKGTPLTSPPKEDLLAPDGPDSMTVRVLTWNVWGREGEWARQDAMREAIASVDPDLVALQEVARDIDFDQLEHLLGQTGLVGVHDSDVIQAPSVGTALASRWAPERVVGALLPSQCPPDAPAPNALAAVIPLPIGVSLLFMAVKPYWPLNAEAVRCREALAIVDLEERLRQAAPSIVAGDFDAKPDGDCMQFFAGNRVLEGRSTHYLNAWDVAGDGSPGHTWTVENPGVAPCVGMGAVEPGHARRIDHILVHGPGFQDWGGFAYRVRAVVTRCEVVFTDPAPSDHYGVLADVELTRVPL
ncbi:MAG: endonuclease/exonuclease/phosphatase family protein [Bifidobacteriaceae bacterium]|jgi:endonuclease/exonuclease/phosphatase family metal-dependent hydrolase|nr:endonuclease/exonuclease/phosphatase family protein [Bifidobacteriaceae bacterium]